MDSLRGEGGSQGTVEKEMLGLTRLVDGGGGEREEEEEGSC